MIFFIAFDALVDVCARLRPNVDRHSFNVRDLRRVPFHLVALRVGFGAMLTARILASGSATFCGRFLVFLKRRAR
jgi:hypothetical protein